MALRLVGRLQGQLLCKEVESKSKAPKLHPQDSATCESVYFIGWRRKTKPQQR